MGPRLHSFGSVALPRSHIHRYRVAFVDCDPAQIVHFSNSASKPAPWLEFMF